MIRIAKPYIVYGETHSRLCADVTWNEQAETFWFEVENVYAEYLCDERLDAFLVLFVSLGMSLNLDIVCEGDVSARLYYQLSEYYIPALSNNMEKYHPISIHAPVNGTPLPSAGAVGVGFSGGVDSMYSLQRHSMGLYPGREVTHLACLNVGAFTGKPFRELFKRAAANTALFAKERGLRSVSVDSNVTELLSQNMLAVCADRNMAAALALQKLWPVYLYSSAADGLGLFAFSEQLAQQYEVLCLECFSTENLQGYLSGMAVSRFDKIRSLTAYEPSFSWLHPCVMGVVGEKTCGKCKKCVTTITTLYALKKLHLYEDIFNLDEFRNNEEEYIIRTLFRSIKFPYERKVFKTMRENNIPLTPKVQRFIRYIKLGSRIKAEKKQFQDDDTSP